MNTLWAVLYSIMAIIIISVGWMVADTTDRECASANNPEKLSYNDWKYKYVNFMTNAIIIFGALMLMYTLYLKYQDKYGESLLYDFSEKRERTIYMIQGSIGVLLIMYSALVFDITSRYCESEQKWRSPLMMFMGAATMASGLYLLFNIYWVHREGHKSRNELKYIEKEKRKSRVLEENPELKKAEKEYEMQKLGKRETEEEIKYEIEVNYERAVDILKNYQPNLKAQKTQKSILETEANGASSPESKKRVTEKINKFMSGRRTSTGGGFMPFQRPEREREQYY